MPVNKSPKLKVESGELKVSKLFSIFNFQFSTVLLAGVACLFFFTASAQSSDSTKPILRHPSHSPKKAMLYSAICPGLGQIYNKKYWKLPILYAGLGTAVYFIFFNQHYFNYYTNQLNTYNPSATNNIYTTSELSDVITYYHQDRDLCIIISAGVYLIGIVDANVDAQMYGFNVSDDISLRFSPGFLPSPLTGSISFVPGFTLIKKF